MDGGKYMQKKKIKISLFLFQSSVSSFEECLKKEAREKSQNFSVKDEVGIEGMIFIHEATENMPEWFDILGKLSKDKIIGIKNISNKAVVIFSYRRRYFALTYGYGRAMIDDSKIVRNFGLMVAASLITKEKIKSMKVTTVEDVLVDTQKQTVDFTNQEQLQINREKDILRSVSGAPQNENVSEFLVGTDSLQSTRKMDPLKIKDDIKFFYDVYVKKAYKNNGFEWLDNIQRITNSSQKELLDNELVNAINNSGKITISANKNFDEDRWQNFYLTGMYKSKPSSILNYKDYLSYIKDKNLKNVIAKLKRDNIVGIDENGISEKISTVYDGIIFEMNMDSKRYLLCYGDWYEVNKDYYQKLINKIDGIPESKLNFIKNNFGENEGEYNKRLSNSNKDYVLMDKVNYKRPGESAVEPCDIITKNKEFVHVKKLKGSAILSHFFAQGLVSATLLTKDSEFRRHINENSRKKFGMDILSENKREQKIEVVFAFITEKSGRLDELLPLFSMINLSQVIDRLKEFGYDYSWARITTN